MLEVKEDNIWFFIEVSVETLVGLHNLVVHLEWVDLRGGLNAMCFVVVEDVRYEVFFILFIFEERQLAS